MTPSTTAPAAASHSSKNGTTSSSKTPLQTDVLEERLIDAEYKIWKKNTPFLYDFVMTHSLEWPSLTTQWLPKTHTAGPNATEHSLLIGTHTTGEQNYLMMATCALPKEQPVVPADSNDNNNNNSTKDTTVKQPAPRYDEEKNEIGGFGLAHSAVGKIDIKVKIQHLGEVNRARYMPQNHFIVASRGPNPEVYIFDLSKHPSVPSPQSTFCPQAVCVGHASEGYGMVWSPHQAGLLATASDDQTVKVWDVNTVLQSPPSTGTDSGGIQVAAHATLSAHQATVEDVDWHAHDPNMLASVGDDQILAIWDLREPSKPLRSKPNAHDRDVNSVAFCPHDEYRLATGSADHDIAIWDLRNLDTRLHTLKSHTDEVYNLSWAPHAEGVLASCSADRRVGVWDLSRIGMEQSVEDAEDGPPELLFLHGGHTSKVSDFSWNVKDPWTIASVAEDNILQVWKMAEEIYVLENEEELPDESDEEDLE
jgi:histone-binding protein RBBP4